MEVDKSGEQRKTHMSLNICSYSTCQPLLLFLSSRALCFFHLSLLLPLWSGLTNQSASSPPLQQSQWGGFSASESPGLPMLLARKHSHLFISIKGESPRSQAYPKVQWHPIKPELQRGSVAVVPMILLPSHLQPLNSNLHFIL